MGLTALQERAEELGATAVSDYRGATMAARFTDPERELTALHAGCGVYDLGYRVKLSITGKDRLRWLNGMITNNIRDLAAGHGVYAFLLNPQGHILGDLYAYNRGDSFLIDTDRSQLEKILATFDHYIIMDDVAVTNISDRMTALGVAGPRSREVARASGIEIPESQPLQVFDAKCTCACECSTCPGVRGDNPGHESYELWLAPDDVRKTWDALVANGATPVGSEAIELQRILAGIPLYGLDIRERDLPQETEQARALNFNKGCYIGQEIVERIRSRGAVHRKFTGFLLDGTPSIAAGAKIVSGDKEVGEVTSVAQIHGVAVKTLALGYVRREVGAPGREVSVGGSRGRVVQLPLADSAMVAEPRSEEKLPA